MSALTDPGAVVVLPVLRCERCAGDRPHRAAPLSRSGWRCLACARRDTGSADGRLLVALALIAGALWLCYLAPVLAALVFIPAAVSAGVVLVALWRAERREAAQARRAFLRSASRPGPVRPLTRDELEAWERIRGEGL